MADASTTTTGESGASGGQTATTNATTPNQTQSSGDWTTSLNDDLKGYIQTKGFKAPQDVVESYRNFEKLQGVPQDRLLKLPEKIEGDEARNIFQRLGMPKEAKDYNVQLPKEMGDETVAQKIKDFAFKNNLTNKQVEGLVQEEIASWNASREQAKAASVAAEAELKQKWGAAFEQNKNIANQARQTFGINDEQFAALDYALGPAKTAEFLHALGVKTGEASFVSGRNPGADLNTPNQAISKINELIKDSSFSARLSNGDTEAKNLWNRLHQEAYPGSVSL